MFRTFPSLEEVCSAIKFCASTFSKKSAEEVISTITQSTSSQAYTQEKGYLIEVTTSNVRGSGTCANVFITLFNKKNDSSGIFNLTRDASVEKNSKSFFQRGQTDVFLIPTSQSVGDITRIRLGHDNTGQFASWLPEKVIVKDILSNKEYQFIVSEWLSTSDGGQTVKDIYVSDSYTIASSSFSEELEYKDITDFAPRAFESLRTFYGIKLDDYVDSWNIQTGKTLKKGAGRSGSQFLKSKCKRFILKTIPFVEVQTLLSALQDYYYHQLSNKQSLIMRIIGLHRIKSIYVIVFCNCLYAPSSVNMTIYDLKGRKPKPGKQFQSKGSGKGYVYKDKDLDRNFFLSKDIKLDFFDTVKKDLDFFIRNNLMDYSFLIGVSKKKDGTVVYPPWARTLESEEEWGELFHVGFIDCLTSYTLKKRVAHGLKRVLWTTWELSTINAIAYASRMGLFLVSIFEDSPLETNKYKSSSLNLSSPKLVKDALLHKRIKLLEAKVDQLSNQVLSLTRFLNTLQDGCRKGAGSSESH
ncbi:phosphatidylinositol 5-phosphate 4-kinase type-2 alpha-like [Zophobas morio]|uniref:phosphatidylinositol 5-phosphate 4-kinase type-2 alpha-like n=1 Tax=Zophobas morio TaxID=2755281 RepID=UPI003083572B